MTIQRAGAVLLVAATLLLSSCGKGAVTGPPAAPSNNWDSMLWDQGSWG